MTKTHIGLAIIDKAALEDGILSLLQFKPLDAEPTPEDANEFISECMADPAFEAVVKDTEATPICLPTFGLLCDMFDQMTALTVDVQTLVALQQKARENVLGGTKPTKPTSNIPGLILPDGKLTGAIVGSDYPSDIPPGATLIFEDIKNQMMNQ